MRRLWLALLAGAALTACSRPPPPHPEAVAPTLTAPDDVCVGPDCAVPGGMR